jgi:hypothetical protein
MAIQFACPSCAQPIEVDDEHAGRMATCPYCRRVVTVPTASTMGTAAAPSARPLPGEAPVSPGPNDAGTAPGEVFRPASPPAPTLGYPASGPLSPELQARQRAARSFGNYALICAGLALALFLVSAVVGAIMTLGAQKAGGAPMTMEQVQKTLQQGPAAGWISAAGMGMMFFALTGLVLSIVSVAMSRSSWRGWAALVIAGLLFSCMCLSAVAQMLLHGVALPSG